MTYGVPFLGASEKTMLGLRDIEWQTTYSTDKDNIVADFYHPCLERSTAYWRAVGYFSSKVLALISPAIEQFYDQNGKMRIVASPALSEEDRTGDPDRSQETSRRRPVAE